MKNLCVFCGANNGIAPIYEEKARELGAALAEKGIGLVYGGARVGLMGAVADAALSGGSSVIGVIPEALMKKELAHQELTQLHVVQTMHERKALMSDLSDGFITLPGGFGTMDETFEIVTWSQLGFHQKPCGILNVNNYYECLNQLVTHMISQGFVKKHHGELLLESDDPKTLLQKMKSFHWESVSKWSGDDIR